METPHENRNDSQTDFKCSYTEKPPAMNSTHVLRKVVQQFRIPGEYLSAEPYGTGHINDTYCVIFNQDGKSVRYIFQRINDKIFKNPIAVMENIQRVTAHIRGKLNGAGETGRAVLTLIFARDNRVWHCDERGHFWRAYIFVERARTYDRVESAAQAFAAAKAFGEFQRQLADLPAPQLHETIPGFHDTVARFAQLERGIAADVANRAALARSEIEFALRRKPLTSCLADAGLPKRVTHNDTKFNNVMLDDISGEAVCVIDLDTVMPGLVAHDFGDMVRTTTSLAKEDEQDLSKVKMQFDLFEALLRGYLTSAKGFLTKGEKQSLAVAGKVITFEIGIRFLTDFLTGDTYFKVHREGHNLDRCRTQFRLIESIEEQEERIRRTVEQC
jgi:hypothetical protein